MNILSIFVNIHLLSVIVYGAQIFAIMPIYGQSHWNVMDAVLQTLVSAGHNVTVITPFIKKEIIANYTQIDSSSYMRRSSSAPFNYVVGANGVEYLTKTHLEACEVIYKDQNFWTALESNKYDIFITQQLSSGCGSYVAYKLRVPMIAITSSAMPTWLNGPFGNPLITSYSSTLNVPMASPETVWDCLTNSYDYVYTNAQNWWYDRAATEIGRTYFGEDAPDAYTLMKRISLLFVNSHFTFHLPRPMAINLIDIGGIHVTEPKPLPEDIQRFIDESPDGVIFFSFGSTVKMDSLPEKMQCSLQDAFAELPQRILWKYDSDVMENQPKNVMIKKWFPQRDILAHPKLKLFIFHGGLSGTNEAIVNQVPILGIPLFADQYRNMANAVYMGMGLSLDYRTLDKQSILSASREIMNNEKYRKNVQRLYQIFKDRPKSPKSLVTFWTEYVIKHKGAKHLRSASVDLSWYQYYLLDLILLILLIFVSLIFFSFCTLLTIKMTIKLFFLYEF